MAFGFRDFRGERSRSRVLGYSDQTGGWTYMSCSQNSFQGVMQGTIYWRILEDTEGDRGSVGDYIGDYYEG